MASMTKEISSKIISEYGNSDKNTGSTEVQIALLTHKIKWLTMNHINHNKKDLHGRLGLTKIVAKRRRLLKYLNKKNLTSYRELLGKLNIRG